MQRDRRKARWAGVGVLVIAGLSQVRDRQAGREWAMPLTDTAEQGPLAESRRHLRRLREMDMAEFANDLALVWQTHGEDLLQGPWPD